MVLLFLGIFASCLTGCSQTQDKSVTVGTLTSYPPYTFEKTPGEQRTTDSVAPGKDSEILQGYAWDILRESLHAMGYTIELRIYPWDEALEAAKSGEVDVIFPTSFKEERTAYFYFSQEPIDTTNFVIYTTQDSPIQWGNLSSLDGLTIAVMHGWDYGSEWDGANYIDKIEVDSILQALQMLDNESIDGFASYEIIVDSTLKNENWPTSYRKLPGFGSSVEYLAGSQNNSKVKEILNAFDTGKRQIIENGTMAEINEKWGLQ